MTDHAARSSPPDRGTAQHRIAAHRVSAERRVASLTRRLDGIVESSAWTPGDDEHDPEGATVAFERAQVLGLLEQARAELGDLDRAAERLHHGSYQRCERCGRPIGEQRLAALPATRTCIDCAAARR